MELSIRREELVRGLHLLQGVRERPEVVPLLSHVLVDPAEDGVALTATDMGVGLRIVLPAEVRTGGAIMLDARKLYEIARQATAEEVVLTSAQTPWVDLLT